VLSKGDPTLTKGDPMRRLSGAFLAAALSVIVLAATAAVAGAATLPSAVTGPPSAITVTKATLSGNVNPNGAATSWSFQYGTSSSYGLATASTSAGAGTGTEAVSAPLTGLTPGTTYDYRLVATSSAGTTYGTETSFQTPAVAPTVVKSPVTSITDTSGVVNADINAQGLATTFVVHYGPTASLGDTSAAVSAGSSDADATTSVTLSKLTTHTGYFIEIVATNAAGTTDGPKVAFTTSGVPVIESESTTSISPTSSKLNATLDADGHATTWYFEYGLTTSYGSRTPSVTAAASATPAAVSATVTGLTANGNYQFRLVAANVDATVYGANSSFTTPGPTLSASRTAISYGGLVTLTGSVPDGKANEAVAIYKDVTPSASFISTTTVLTGAGGTWTYRIRPRIGTSFKAIWNSEVSPVVGVAVSPSVSLLIQNKTHFVTRVAAQGSFDGRLVRLQRLEKSTWRTIGARYLNKSSETTFSPKLPKGTSRVRVTLTTFQAGPGYVAGYSAIHRFSE
jgi:hypothetical protein